MSIFEDPSYDIVPFQSLSRPSMQPTEDRFMANPYYRAMLERQKPGWRAAVTEHRARVDAEALAEREADDSVDAQPSEAKKLPQKSDTDSTTAASTSTPSSRSVSAASDPAGQPSTAPTSRSTSGSSSKAAGMASDSKTAPLTYDERLANVRAQARIEMENKGAAPVTEFGRMMYMFMFQPEKVFDMKTGQLLHSKRSRPNPSGLDGTPENSASKKRLRSSSPDAPAADVRVKKTRTH